MVGVIVRGDATARGKRKRADYILYYRSNLPLAVVEAKDNRHNIGDGMQQGIMYAQCLEVPFVYSSNGDGFLEHDMTSGKEREIKLSVDFNYESHTRFYIHNYSMTFYIALLETIIILKFIM